MPTKDQAVYPTLIPGAHEFPGPWRVEELGPGDPEGGVNGPSTNKVDRELRVPKPQLPHDWIIQDHELAHVGRPQIDRSGNNWRDRVRAMLEETAVDADIIRRIGRDPRPARFKYDYAKWPRPTEEYALACEYLQCWSTGQISHRHKDGGAFTQYFDDLKAGIEALDNGPAKLEALYKAARAVWADDSPLNCATTADWLATQFVPVNVPPPPPPPPSKVACPTCGSKKITATLRDGQVIMGVQMVQVTLLCRACGWTETYEAEPTDAARMEPNKDLEVKDERTIRESTSSGAEEQEDGESEDGQAGEDEEAEDAESGSEVEEGDASGGDAEPGDSESEGQDTSDQPGEGQGQGPLASHEELVQQAHDVLSRPGKLDRHDFGFDPLAREHNITGEPEKPPEKRGLQKERTEITQAELQAEIDAERVARKQGAASQAELLTGITPYGNVDVHRHTFGRATSRTIATVWRSTDAGPTLKFPQYLYPSGRVFGAKAPGGTIVMDRSGSMSWHAEVINEIMTRGLLPNVCVAHSSFHGTKNPYYPSGGGTYICRLCITAFGGRYDPVDPKTVEPEHTGANSGMDPAALYYAAKYLPKPIVWVSDGIVGGDQGRACDAVMAQYRIPRVITLEDAISYLQGRAVPGWWQAATVNTRWIRIGSIVVQSKGTSNMETMAEARKWARLRSERRYAS